MTAKHAATIRFKKGLFIALMLCTLMTSVAAFAQGLSPYRTQEEEESAYNALMDEKNEIEAKLEKREQRIDELTAQSKDLTRQLEDQHRRIEVCSSDPSLASRVVCYDEIARDYGFKTHSDMQTQSERLKDHGFWTISKRKNDMGDEVIYLKVDSVQPVISRAGARKTPTFTIRCAGKRTDAYLDWKSPLADYKVFIKDQQINYKIGNGKLLTENWELSQDNHAAFSPNPVEFIKLLKGQTKLAIVITPYTDNTATLVFPLQGFSKALDVLVKECYNKKSTVQ